VGKAARNQKKVLCIFCGQRRSRAREDIIPFWLSREIGTNEPHLNFTLHGPRDGPFTTRSPRVGEITVLKLKEVCVRCNGGWMSRLEVQARPIVTSMVHSRTAALSVREQRKLAAWAQMKSIALDAYAAGNRGQSRLLPDHVAHTFFRSHQPIMDSLVVVGTVHAPIGGPVEYARDSSMVPARGHPMKFVCVTFRFANLFLQTMIGSFDSPNDPWLRFRPNDSRLIRCWPPHIDNDLMWPPASSINGSDFMTLSRLDPGAHPLSPEAQRSPGWLGQRSVVWDESS
jgi:hypothetical protein